MANVNMFNSKIRKKMSEQVGVVSIPDVRKIKRYGT